MTVAAPGGTRRLHEGDWISVDGFTGEVVAGKVVTQPSEVEAVLIEGAERGGRPALPAVRPPARLGRQGAAPQGARQRRPARPGGDGGEAGRAGDRPVPHRAHVLRRGEDRPDAGDDRRRDRGGAARGAGEAAPVPAGRLRRPLPGHGVASGDRSGPSTRRCTSSSRRTEAGVVDLARAAGKSVARVRARIDELHEANPMLGHRGCRLGITYPEITEMQARAILEAALDVRAEGVKAQPEIMIPLVGTKTELDDQARVVRETAEKVFAERGKRIPYLVGTMIEVPRGALTAGEIAKTAEFFSFGTNDLTQTTFGLSRDDVGPVLSKYVAEGHLRGRPVRLHRPGRRGPAHEDRHRGRATHQARPQARHLRRARRRPVVRRVLPRDRARLRLLLPVPAPDRPPRGRAGRAEAATDGGGRGEGGRARRPSRGRRPPRGRRRRRGGRRCAGHRFVPGRFGGGRTHTGCARRSASSPGAPPPSLTVCHPSTTMPISR